MCIKHGENWFKVRFLDGVEIYKIKLQLKCLRFCRRIGMGLRVNKVTLLLFPAWLLFVLLVLMWGNHRGQTLSVMDLLWQCKEDIFTSVIIVLIVNTVRAIREHKKSIWYRRVCWTNLMDEIDILLEYMYLQVTGKCGPYAVLLSRERFAVFEKEIKGLVVCDEKIHAHLTRLRDICVQIRQDRRYERLYSTDDASFDHVNACMSRIIELSDEEVIKYISLLFDLVYNFGYIWNVDMDIRIKIDKILHEQYGYKNYDDRFLYEIYCCKELNIPPRERTLSIINKETEKRNMKCMKNRKCFFLTVMAIATLLLIPFLLYRYVFCGAEGSEWASFLGSYVGGVVSLLGVFATIYFSNKQVNDQIKKASEQIALQKEELEEQKRRQKEQYRLDNIPILDLKLVPNSNALNEMCFCYNLINPEIYSNTDIFCNTLRINLLISNVGLGAALNFRFKCKSVEYDEKSVSYYAALQTLKANDAQEQCFSFLYPLFKIKPDRTVAHEYKFEMSIYYDDILGNCYEKKVRLSFFSEGYLRDDDIEPIMLHIVDQDRGQLTEDPLRG